AAAFVLGWLVENWLDTAGRRSVLRWLAAVLTAQAIIYAGGVSWLKLLGLPAGQAGSLSWAEAVGLGLTPFLPGVALKAALLSLCLPAGWWAVERRLRT
ncbi:MAG: biotin transporter BioY, partial [Terriglobia bacterium]